MRTKLDGVGTIDYRPSTNYLHHFSWTKIKGNICPGHTWPVKHLGGMFFLIKLWLLNMAHHIVNFFTKWRKGLIFYNLCFKFYLVLCGKVWPAGVFCCSWGCLLVLLAGLELAAWQPGEQLASAMASGQTRTLEAKIKLQVFIRASVNLMWHNGRLFVIKYLSKSFNMTLN